MFRKKPFFLKSLLPLFVAFFAAAAFFISYNNYLLDKSLANLRVSLKKLERAEESDIAQTVKDILDDTFIMEVVRENLDATTLAKIEFTTQIVERVSESGDELLLEDALEFLRDVIERKEGDRAAIANTLDTVLINLNPVQRKENKASIERSIESLEKSLLSAQGLGLQKIHFEIARHQMLLKEWTKALENFDKIQEIDSDSTVAKQAMFYSAIVHKFQGDYLQAKEIFSQLKGDLSGEMQALTSFEEGDTLYRMGQFDAAAEIFESAFRTDPSLEINQIAQFRAGYIRIHDLKRVKDFDEAFGRGPGIRIEKITDFEPGEINKFYNLVVEEKTHQDLFDLIEEAPESKLVPSIARAYRNRGYNLARQGFELFRRGQYTQAFSRFIFSEEQFNLAIQIEPNDALAHTGKAIALFYLKDPESALEEARLAKSLDSKNSTVLANLGFVLAENLMVDEAIEEFTAALKLSPNSSILNYNLGTLYIIKGEREKAITSLKKAQLIDPEMVNTLNNIGYVYLLEKRYREAKRSFERVISLQEDYTEGRYNLAMLLYNLGRYEEAKKHFQRLQRLRPSYRKTKWFLSEIAEKEKEGFLLE
ncbi:MAG: tetratricopeptide repeat protein [Candidatus Omnitrophica bacterium]|nr:tetratricopeptide repeat protein [Candidatus Omnitrophota bacterium]